MRDWQRRLCIFYSPHCTHPFYHIQTICNFRLSRNDDNNRQGCLLSLNNTRENAERHAPTDLNNPHARLTHIWYRLKRKILTLLSNSFHQLTTAAAVGIDTVVLPPFRDINIKNPWDAHCVYIAHMRSRNTWMLYLIHILIHIFNINILIQNFLFNHYPYLEKTLY